MLGHEAVSEPGVLDLRGRTAGVPPDMRWPAGHRVVVSGLPGSGKSTLMRRVAAVDGRLVRIDSQDVRETWSRRLPPRLPYAVYRPLVRAAHYTRLWRALRSEASVVVHDCGRTPWVRRLMARDARRRRRGFHLVVLDVPPPVALAGQLTRGRAVSARAFAGHRRATARLVAGLNAGRLPGGCASAVLLDRPAASAVRVMRFAPPAPPV
jgi:predicted kinase